MRRKRTKSLLEMKFDEARKFLLKSSSFFSVSLPQYFSFEKIINDVESTLAVNDLSLFYKHGAKPAESDSVNYDLYNNKDGKFSWRRLQIIHPAIYVDLVNKITNPSNWKILTDRFNILQNNRRIKCISIPKESITEKNDLAETILDWWVQIEQESLKQSLDYNMIMVTDINDCYGSIYTHSISWALHTKKMAKKRRFDSTLLGNILDRSIQSMQNGQTNGIPQGSVLMDFIAELVLGYADEILTERLSNDNIKDYFILRYRDDYRIFANDSNTLGRIAKHLSDVLLSLNFRMNSAKTFSSSEIIKSSIKPDKLEWNKSKQFTEFNLTDDKTCMHQKQLLLIHSFSNEHSNSGSIIKALAKYYKTIMNFTNAPKDTEQCIAIILDIAVNNPKCFSLCFAIIGKLLSLLKNKSAAEKISNKIFKKVNELPNSNYAEIWLYRALLKVTPKKINNLKTSKELYGITKKIWNSDWISSATPLFNVLENSCIIDNAVMKTIDMIIRADEINPFEYED